VHDVLELVENFLTVNFREEGDRFPGPFINYHLGLQTHGEIRVDDMMLECSRAPRGDEDRLYSFLEMDVPYGPVLTSDWYGDGGDQIGDIPVLAKLVNSLLHWGNLESADLLCQREVLEIECSETGVSEVLGQNPVGGAHVPLIHPMATHKVLRR
jgi:hypothetical protein